jgi:hypothetical protein
MSKRNREMRPFKIALNWRVGFAQPVGEFIDGEREMRFAQFPVHSYKTRNAARMDASRPGDFWPNMPAFTYIKGRRPRKLIELQVNYSAE